MQQWQPPPPPPPPWGTPQASSCSWQWMPPSAGYDQPHPFQMQTLAYPGTEPGQMLSNYPAHTSVYGYDYSVPSYGPLPPQPQSPYGLSAPLPPLSSMLAPYAWPASAISMEPPVTTCSTDSCSQGPSASTQRSSKPSKKARCAAPPLQPPMSPAPQPQLQLRTPSYRSVAGPTAAPIASTYAAPAAALPASMPSHSYSSASQAAAARAPFAASYASLFPSPSCSTSLQCTFGGARPPAAAAPASAFAPRSSICGVNWPRESAPTVPRYSAAGSGTLPFTPASTASNSDLHLSAFALAAHTSSPGLKIGPAAAAHATSSQITTPTADYGSMASQSTPIVNLQTATQIETDGDPASPDVDSASPLPPQPPFAASQPPDAAPSASLPPLSSVSRSSPAAAAAALFMAMTGGQGTYVSAPTGIGLSEASGLSGPSTASAHDVALAPPLQPLGALQLAPATPPGLSDWNPASSVAAGAPSASSSPPTAAHAGSVLDEGASSASPPMPTGATLLQRVPTAVQPPAASGSALVALQLAAPSSAADTAVVSACIPALPSASSPTLDPESEHILAPAAGSPASGLAALDHAPATEKLERAAASSQATTQAATSEFLNRTLTRTQIGHNDQLQTAQDPLCTRSPSELSEPSVAPASVRPLPALSPPLAHSPPQPPRAPAAGAEPSNSTSSAPATCTLAPAEFEAASTSSSEPAAERPALDAGATSAPAPPPGAPLQQASSAVQPAAHAAPGASATKGLERVCNVNAAADASAMPAPLSSAPKAISAAAASLQAATPKCSAHAGTNSCIHALQPTPTVETLIQAPRVQSPQKPTLTAAAPPVSVVPPTSTSTSVSLSGSAPLASLDLIAKQQQQLPIRGALLGSSSSIASSRSAAAPSASSLKPAAAGAVLATGAASAPAPPPSTPLQRETGAVHGQPAALSAPSYSAGGIATSLAASASLSGAPESGPAAAAPPSSQSPSLLAALISSASGPALVPAYIDLDSSSNLWPAPILPAGQNMAAVAVHVMLEPDSGLNSMPECAAPADSATGVHPKPMLMITAGCAAQFATRIQSPHSPPVPTSTAAALPASAAARGGPSAAPASPAPRAPVLQRPEAQAPAPQRQPQQLPIPGAVRVEIPGPRPGAVRVGPLGSGPFGVACAPSMAALSVVSRSKPAPAGPAHIAGATTSAPAPPPPARFPPPAAVRVAFPGPARRLSSAPAPPRAPSAPLQCASSATQPAAPAPSPSAPLQCASSAAQLAAAPAFVLAPAATSALAPQLSVRMPLIALCEPTASAVRPAIAPCSSASVSASTAAAAAAEPAAVRTAVASPASAPLSPTHRHQLTPPPPAATCTGTGDGSTDRVSDCSPAPAPSTSCSSERVPDCNLSPSSPESGLAASDPAPGLGFMHAEVVADRDGLESAENSPQISMSDCSADESIDRKLRASPDIDMQDTTRAEPWNLKDVNIGSPAAPQADEMDLNQSTGSNVEALKTLEGDRVTAEGELERTFKGVYDTGRASFSGYFKWRKQRFNTSAVCGSQKETARVRDRCILICQWLDDRAGIAADRRIPDSYLNFPRSDYEHERFFTELQKGAPDLVAIGSAKSGKSLRAAVKGFLVAMEGRGEQRAGLGATDSVPEKEQGVEVQEKGKEPARTSTRNSAAPSQVAGSPAPTKPQAAKARRGGRDRYHGIRYDHAHKQSFSGYATWRGTQFGTGSCSTAKDAARYRDHIIIACRWVDEKAGRPERSRNLKMNFPRNYYARARFFEDLKLGNLRVPTDASPKRAMRAIRAFLEERRPRKPTPHKGRAHEEDEHGGSDADRSEGEQSEEDRDLSCCGQQEDVDEANGSSGEEEEANLKEEEEDDEDDEEEDDAERSGSSDHSAMPVGTEEQCMRRRWKSLVQSPRSSEFVYRNHGKFVAGFSLQIWRLKVISPHFDTEAEAQRFKDRCEIAWFGPQCEQKFEHVKLHFPEQEYTGESFYKKLFTGPKAARPLIADNDPDWSKDIAASVRKTVRFVMDEMGVAETYCMFPKGSRANQQLAASSSSVAASGMPAAGAKGSATAAKLKSEGSGSNSAGTLTRAPSASAGAKRSLEERCAATPDAAEEDLVAALKRVKTEPLDVDTERARPAHQARFPLHKTPKNTVPHEMPLAPSPPAAALLAAAPATHSAMPNPTSPVASPAPAAAPAVCTQLPLAPAPAMPGVALSVADPGILTHDSPPNPIPSPPMPAADVPLPMPAAAFGTPVVYAQEQPAVVPPLARAPAPPSAAAASAPDPGTLLRWRPAAVLAWLVRVHVLEQTDPEYECLRRLQLTGRTLLRLPACVLRARLLDKHRELYPGAEAHTLDAMLFSWDREVSMLLAKAKQRIANDPSKAEELAEIEALVQARFEEAAAAAKGAQ